MNLPNKIAGGIAFDPDHWNEDGYIFRKRLKTSTLVLYRTDAVVYRSFKPACAGTVTAGKGEVGGKPSWRSLQRLVFLLNNCDTPMESMLTLTMTPPVFRNNSVKFHRNVMTLAGKKLRYDGVENYVWVREFQKNNSVHWHYFTDMKVSERPGAVNELLSDRWRRWMVNHYRRHGWISNDCCRGMLNGNGRDFRGCCRFEQLRDSAGGRYAGKEGSKRFQKSANRGWEKAGRWWAATKGVVCTPISTAKVAADKLQTATIKVDGEDHEVIHKIQFNRGIEGQLTYQSVDDGLAEGLEVPET